MRKLLYIIVISALIAVPVQRSDVGDLLPVELVMVYVQEDSVTIRTDTGNIGTGRDAAEAYRDLKESASAEIFLDTADCMLLAGKANECIESLQAYLKPNIRVCTAAPDTDLQSAAMYLSEHAPRYRLKEMEKGLEIELLTQTWNGFKLT